MHATLSRLVFAIAGGAALSACAGGPDEPRIPIPEDAGLYAILSEDELLRLDGGGEWESETWPQRSDLSPAQQFVVYDPSLARDGGANAAIWEVAWVRSAIRNDGSAGPVDGSQWAVAPLESHRVPLDVRTVIDHPDMLHVVPDGPLSPGLYALQLRNGATMRQARFGVQWSSLDRQEYSAAHCVDLRPGAEPGYEPCVAAAQAAGDGNGSNLRIELADPVKQTAGGLAVLIIEGTVTNDSATTLRVPMLEATLRDRAGTVLQRWPFMPNDSQLAPGQTTSFRTEAQQPPAAAAKVNVSIETRNASSTP